MSPAPPSARPRILAVTLGEPWDPARQSVSNLHLFKALHRRGVMEGAVNARPTLVHKVERVGSLSRDPEVEAQRMDSSSTWLSPLARHMMDATGWWRARGMNPRPDTLLQIGAWYALDRLPGLEPRLRCSFHDGNVAVFLRRPDLVLDRDSRAVRRVLAHERRVYDGLDLIMPRSEWLRRSFVEDFGQDPEKLVTVGAGVNLPDVPEVPERDFARPRVLFVGRDFARKGGREVLAAFERVRARRPDAELWLAGPPTAPAGGPGIRWFGQIRRDDPAREAELLRLYSEATLFVMPSFFEPWGSVFLEAMAHGLPCVAGDVGALPEVIADGVSGYVTPPGDADRLAEVLLSLVEDPDASRSMGEAGRRRVLERFTWDRVAERMEAAIASRSAA